MDIRDVISAQSAHRYANPSTIHLKLNIFQGFELSPFLEALRSARNPNYELRLDCVMLGDSFLTTHLGYGSTRLESEEMQELFTRMLLSMLVDIRHAMLAADIQDDVFLIFDMPYGSARHVDLGLRNAERALAYGAQAIKLEVASSDHLGIMEELSSNGVTVIAHIGYSPQLGGEKLVGRTVSGAERLFQQARRCRDSGASALVLEGVATPVLRCLAALNDACLPTYAIFSGMAPFSGQSVNVWDAVYRPPFPARFFPPSAELPVETYPSAYQYATIKDSCKRLFEGMGSLYPLERHGNMTSEEISSLMARNPWQSQPDAGGVIEWPAVGNQSFPLSNDSTNGFP